MREIAISVENLGKKYRIGARHPSTNGRRSLARNISSPFRYLAANLKKPLDEEIIWALKNVSFEVEKGEVLGIIGRNGAGKSTLLKILSRITEPTSGRIVLDGRVGSLLEVGTGFHPELTGRENTYLNGAILGMRKAEIEGKFDEIVDFAGVEKFIDTPVKRYSSGMYVRLAFAVAAHLETEILLVDEVLAVGDASFQKKCLGKMGDLSSLGRTILFVSHNLSAIASLCQRCIHVHEGSIKAIGIPNEIVSYYLQGSKNGKDRGCKDFETRSDLPLIIKSVRTLGKDGSVSSEFRRAEDIVVQIRGEVLVPGQDYHIAVDVRTLEDTLLFRTHSFEQPRSYGILAEKREFILECVIPSNLLPANTYRLGIHSAIAGVKELQRHNRALEFEVFQVDLLGNKFFESRGILTPACHWRIS